MDYIEKISRCYKGKILLHSAYTGPKNKMIPEVIYSILSVSNGITETMLLPDTGKKAEISWIIYSHDMILEWTEFYTENYHIKGTVFSDDGADSLFIIKSDGMITCFNCIDNEETKVADTLLDFFP